MFRAIETSGVSPDQERSRVRRAADAAGIPLQLGLTQGGTDGSSFTFWGAPDQGLSWQGRYSHSPGEVLDLRDLDMLTQLVVAVASTGERQRTVGALRIWLGDAVIARDAEQGKQYDVGPGGRFLINTVRRGVRASSTLLQNLESRGQSVFDLYIVRQPWYSSSGR